MRVYCTTIDNPLHLKNPYQIDLVRAKESIVSQVPITILKLPFNGVDKDTTIVCLSTEEVIRENISSQNTQKSVFTFMQSLTMVVSEQTKFASTKTEGSKIRCCDSKLHRSST